MRVHGGTVNHTCGIEPLMGHHLELVFASNVAAARGDGKAAATVGQTYNTRVHA